MARGALRRRAPERQGELFSTISGLENEPLYTPDNVEIDYERDLGYPGVYPFTRGVYPSMYRGKLWTMRQFAGFGTAEETNERFRYLLEHGQTGLSTAFDMPTLMGYDSDHSALARRGRPRGRRRSTRSPTWRRSSRGIPLGEVSTSMTINSPAAMLLAFYVCVGEQQGVPRDGAARDDPDGHPQGVHRAEGVDLPARAVDAAGRGHDRVLLATRCRAGIPISISGYHIREAGSNAAQELAFTLADGFAYVDACVERGLDVDDFAPRLSFFFNAHLDFFEEIAKFRAARRIWARELRDRYGAKNPRSWLMRFHTQTAGVSLTAQQPEVNIVRTALEALAAVLGGTQSLHTNSFDEALALPTEDAVRIALRTQQVIAHETGVVNTIDPLGGSYYVEELTNRARGRQAYDYFDRIEKLGGVVAGDQGELLPARDRRGVVPLPVRGRGEAARRSSASTATSSTTSAELEILRIDPALEQQADRARAGAARAPRLGRGRGGARAAEGGRRARGREPDAADRRRLACLRDDGRDVRRAPRGLGRLARNARLLRVS